MAGERPPTWIRFEDRPWTPVGPGAREKVVEAGDRRLRLLELTETFEEDGWCRHPHWGLLLEGRMELELPTDRVSLQAGDALGLEADETHRHRAHVASGERAVLFLVEPTRG